MTSAAERPRLAVPYDIGSTSPMELAQRIGHRCEIVWIIDSDDATLGPMRRLLPRLGSVVGIDRSSEAGILAPLHDEHLDGVVAFADSQLEIASLIAAEHHLASNPQSVVTFLNDKEAQRAALERAGIDVPRFCRLPANTTTSSAVELLSELHYPLVLKPIRGDSSRETRELLDDEALTSLFDDWSRSLGGSPEEYIAEEYIADGAWPGHPYLGHREFGQYVSVESIVATGTVVPLEITGKFALAPPFRETGNFMPDPLDGDERAEIFELAQRAALALGVRSGVLHTEIKFSSRGPTVIEVNGRIGGGAIDAIFARRRGVSLTELAVRIALGERPQLDATPSPEGPATECFHYQYFVQPPMSAKRLLSLNADSLTTAGLGVEEVVSNRSIGDELDWRAGSHGYVLRVAGVADTLDALRSVPAFVERHVAVVYE